MELRGWELIVVLSLLVLILYHLCPRVTRPLAERKTWRRTYFVLGLGMDGCIADALWRTDPRLAGPGDSTPEDMLRFASDFMKLCNTDYNLQWNKNYLQTEFYSILINLNEHNLQFVFHDNKLRFLALKWTNNKEFDSLRSPLFNGDIQEESMANFMEFRNKLLDTVQFLVKHKRLR